MEYHGADLDPVLFCEQEIRADQKLLEAVISGKMVFPEGLPLLGFIEAAQRIRESENLPRMILQLFPDL